MLFGSRRFHRLLVCSSRFPPCHFLSVWFSFFYSQLISERRNLQKKEKQNEGLTNRHLKHVFQTGFYRNFQVVYSVSERSFYSLVDDQFLGADCPKLLMEIDRWVLKNECQIRASIFLCGMFPLMWSIQWVCGENELEQSAYSYLRIRMSLIQGHFIVTRSWGLKWIGQLILISFKLNKVHLQ